MGRGNTHTHAKKFNISRISGNFGYVFLCLNNCTTYECRSAYAHTIILNCAAPRTNCTVSQEGAWKSLARVTCSKFLASSSATQPAVTTTWHSTSPFTVQYYCTPSPVVQHPWLVHPSSWLMCVCMSHHLMRTTPRQHKSFWVKRFHFLHNWLS